MAEIARRRFQIHLSTAMVLSLTAGGAIWINTLNRGLSEFYVGYDYGPLKMEAYPASHGFPFTSVYRNGYTWEQEHYISRGPYPWEPPKKAIGTLPDKIEYSSLLADLAFALAVLFTSWILCERSIRRRAARRME